MSNNKLRNKRLVSKKMLQIGEEGGSSSQIHKLSNIAGVHNPTGGIFASRRFGG